LTKISYSFGAILRKPPHAHKHILFADVCDTKTQTDFGEGKHALFPSQSGGNVHTCNLPSLSYEENKNPEIGKIYPIHIGKLSPVLEDIGKHIPMAGKLGDTTPKNIGETLPKSKGDTRTPKNIFGNLVGGVGKIGRRRKGQKTFLGGSKDDKSTPNIFPTSSTVPATQTGTFPYLLRKSFPRIQNPPKLREKHGISAEILQNQGEQTSNIEGIHPEKLIEVQHDPLNSQNKIPQGELNLRGKPRQVERLRKPLRREPLANYGLRQHQPTGR